MLFLFLLWLVIGLLIGCLGWLAQCVPSSWRSLAWVWLPVLGAVVACCVGWLGALLFGRLLSTALVLWVTVLCVLALPRCVDWIRRVLYLRFLAKKI
jgi:hypothetical protein